jgi:hypothetical protein
LCKVRERWRPPQMEQKFDESAISLPQLLQIMFHLLSKAFKSHGAS